MAVSPPSPLVQSLSGHGTLLMKMAIMSLGKNYDVMDQNKVVLCTIGLDASQNVKGQLVGAAVGSIAGDYVGRWATRRREYTYDVKDPHGNLAMQIRKDVGGNAATFHVVDTPTQSEVGRIEMQRSLLGGLKATWVSPDGQVYLHTRGNIIRRKYEILGPGGEVWGRVRHKILAVRDVWELELDPRVNHLYSALFATVLDFEKKM
ncbi:MAG TPA: hypothetical protein VN842_01195 [Thermoplasmata archaeon]|nr:hypothetical protein [Thermoplasmata archaeon]